MPLSHSAMDRAVREINLALRTTPYRKYNTRITKWQAIIEQLIDGRRSGEFSSTASLMAQTSDYIKKLSEEDREKLWLETDSAREFPHLWNIPLKEFIDVLAPEVHQAVLGPIFRAVRRRRRKINNVIEQP